MSEHIVPVRVYVTIFPGAAGGYGVDVWRRFRIFPGQLNTIIAMTIAVMKATFVVLYFMHVRYSSRLIWVIVASALVLDGDTVRADVQRLLDPRLASGLTHSVFLPRIQLVSRTSISRLQDGQFKRMVASEVLIGAPTERTVAVNFVVMEKVAHHDHRQDETGDEQRDTEDESDGRALAERQADHEAGNKEHQANSATLKEKL